MMKAIICAALSIIATLAQAEFTCKVSVGKASSAGATRDGTITWKNTGSAAVAAPYVRLDAGDGVSVRFSETEPWTKSLEFLATSPGAQASSLKGFEKGELKFFCQSPSDDGKLELSYTLASAEAFPWSDIGDSLKPSFVSDAAWAFALKTLKVRLGTTWNSYLGRFRADADYLASSGRPVNRMDRLWQFEINRALGIDPAVSTLASAVDAARSARGLGVTLSRSYPSAMYARFNKGMFGYGWTDNLSVYAELTDATLTFRMPGGGSYSFAKAGGVWEPEDLRDKSTLTENASAYVLSYQNGTKQTFAKANMRTSSITDNSGNTLTFTWNGTQLAKVTHTDGQSLTFAYSNGLLVSATDDCGRKTTYAYSGELLTSVTASDGLVTRYEYRAADGTAAARVLSRITHPDGTATEFAYDAEGLVASVSINGGKEKTTILRADGVVTLVQPDGGKTVLKTGVSGEALETKDALGGTSVNRYTEDGLLKSMTTPSGLSGSLSHDALGRVAKSVSAGGNATAFAYEETFGNLKTVTDAKSHAVTYGYDAKGRGTSVSFPDGSMSKVEYNDRGDVVKSYNRRGQSIAYTYDARGRVTKKTWSTGRTFSYSYDAHGNVTTATDSETGTVTMEYDAAERMTKIVYPGGRGFTFAYDDGGRLARRASLDGAAERFLYDQQGRLESVTDDNGHAYLQNAYEESTGRLIRQENGNGTSTAYLYDKLGRVTSIEHCNAEGRIVEALQYCYDVDGRCIRASSLLGEERYGYDADGQLTGVDYPNDTYQSFAYDAVGNRTTSNKATYTVNAMNQYTQAEGGGEVTTFAYDADGNMISMMDSNGTITYTYDTLNRLVAVKNPTAGIDWSCKYDVFGNRVSVTENGVTTERVYLQGALPSVAAEYVNGQLKERHILVGAVRIADVSGEAVSSPLEQEGAIRYLHADLIGSVRLVTGDDGTVQDRASYLAFGGLRTGSLESSAGYVGTLGVETDSTGLLFMRNRYYSPDLGRFIQMDPIGLGGADANLYRYCANNVICSMDHVGLFRYKAKGAVMENFINENGLDWMPGSSVLPYMYDFCTFSTHHFATEIWPALWIGIDAGMRFWPNFLPGGFAISTLWSTVVDHYSGGDVANDLASGLSSGGLELSEHLANVTGEMTTGWQRTFKGAKFGGNLFSGLTTGYRLVDGITGLMLKNNGKTVSVNVNPASGGGGGDTPGAGGRIMNEGDWIQIVRSADEALKAQGDYLGPLPVNLSLGADITLSHGESAIDRSFTGCLDGNGHTLTILLGEGELLGRFYENTPTGAVFRNVTFKGTRASDRYGECRFENCHVEYDGASAGGLAAEASDCEFVNCSANVALRPYCEQGAGGLVGSAYDCLFKNCWTRGFVQGRRTDAVGGLVGHAGWQTKIVDCWSSCEVSGGYSVGGLIGRVQNGNIVGKICSISNCKATGDVHGCCLVGGFAGMLRGLCAVSNCSSTGRVWEDETATPYSDYEYEWSSFGGFAGLIDYPYSGAEAEYDNFVIKDCCSTGDVMAENSGWVGGFAGVVDGSRSYSIIRISRCYATGSVRAFSRMGGFIGRAEECVLSDCFASGAVTSTYADHYVSGFVGISDDSDPIELHRCYASGKVIATNLWAESVGAKGLVTDLADRRFESDSCYWNIDTTGQKTSDTGIGLSAAAAKKSSSFVGWDFGNTWKMDGGRLMLPGVGADLPGAEGMAHFVAEDAISVVGGNEGCTVGGTGKYEVDETVTLTATPAADCLFDGWYSDPACTKLASTDATYSFTVEDPEQRVYAKFSTKESKLDATRLYSYDKYVAERGQRSVFLVDGTAPIGTALTVSGLPEGFDFYGDKLMIAGTPTRTMSTTITVILSNAAGTKTKKIPFVVVAPEDEEEDPACAEFTVATVAAKEGDVLRIPVWGGCADRPCSVRLCLAYQSAAAADLDLTKASVDGKTVKSMKFPYVLNWAAGEFGEKVVEIPVKADKTVEDDEVLTFQLAADSGIGIGERNVCTVTIADENTFATLQDGVMNPGLKVATSGSGKWQVAAGNASDPNCVFGLYHAESPVLQEGKSASLTFSSVKGTGTFYFWMRYSNATAETTPSKLSVYVGKNFLASIEHGDVTNEWRRFNFTIEGSAKSTSSVAFEFIQGSDPNTHVELSNVYWDNGTAGKVYDVYAATVNSEGGYVTGSGPYAGGATAKLSAKARPGWTFSAWYTLQGGQYVYWGDKASVSYKVTNNLSIYARFIKTPYVRGLSDPADGGKVSGSGYVASGKKVTLKASANKNFTFEGWYAAKAGEPERIDENVLITACASLVIDNSAKPAAPSKTTYVITNVTGDVTYFAKFKSYPEAFVSIEATDGNEYAGKITGTGKYAPGKKVTLKATANRGYVFAGWWPGDAAVGGGQGLAALPAGEPVSRLASYVLTMPTNDVELVAAFVTAEEDATNIVASVNGMAFGAGSGGEGAAVTKMATNVMAGVYLAWPVAADALSLPTVKVAGLPSGLKFTAKPVTKTTGSGTSKTVVTNVAANTIYGTPTKASTVDKYGEVKPSSVKITVTTAGKSKADYVISLTVDPIPDFAVGTFGGWYGDGEDVLGSATLTLAANGKVSGKVLMPVDGKGKAYNFKADSLSGFSRADDGSVTNVTVAATLTGENKAAVPLALTFAPDEIGIGCVEGTFDSPWSGGLWLGQNGWKRGGYVFPNIPKNIVKTLDDGLTLTFKKNGVVSIGGKIVGDDGVKLVSAKGSAQLVSDPESADGFLLLVYVPPAKNLASGLCRTYSVKLDDPAGDNAVTDVQVTER